MENNDNSIKSGFSDQLLDLAIKKMKMVILANGPCSKASFIIPASDQAAQTVARWSSSARADEFLERESASVLDPLLVNVKTLLQRLMQEADAASGNDWISLQISPSLSDEPDAPLVAMGAYCPASKWMPNNLIAD